MITLDCLGQRCPLPVIALARTIGRVAVGDGGGGTEDGS